jgi:hypothetical protein
MHSHPRDHDHRYHHDHGESRSQHVVLDLGEGVGALVVHTSTELLGAEIEISPAGDDALRQHKAVLTRSAGETTLHVLVYDNLAEGDYTLWLDGTAWRRGVSVTGGAVSELDLRVA